MLDLLQKGKIPIMMPTIPLRCYFLKEFHLPKLFLRPIIDTLVRLEINDLLLVGLFKSIIPELFTLTKSFLLFRIRERLTIAIILDLRPIKLSFFIPTGD